MDRYEEWIKSKYNRDTACGLCAEAVKLMKAEYPELEITNGFVEDAFWGKREHWWLKTPDGAVIDPTKAQFPAIISYEEVDNSHPVRNYPRGRCANCGEMYYVGKDYNDNTVCSSKCFRAYSAYLMNNC
jgi:hypothetical protein